MLRQIALGLHTSSFGEYKLIKDSKDYNFTICIRLEIREEMVGGNLFIQNHVINPLIPLGVINV